MNATQLAYSEDKSTRAPGWPFLPIIMVTAGVLSLMDGVITVSASIPPGATVTVSSGLAACVAGLLFFAVGQGLRWLQLIEWRLGARGNSTS